MGSVQRGEPRRIHSAQRDPGAIDKPCQRSRPVNAQRSGARVGAGTVHRRNENKSSANLASPRGLAFIMHR